MLALLFFYIPNMPTQFSASSLALVVVAYLSIILINNNLVLIYN